MRSFPANVNDGLFKGAIFGNYLLRRFGHLDVSYPILSWVIAFPEKFDAENTSGSSLTVYKLYFYNLFSFNWRSLIDDNKLVPVEKSWPLQLMVLSLSKKGIGIKRRWKQICTINMISRTATSKGGLKYIDRSSMHGNIMPPRLLLQNQPSKY